MKNIEKQKTKTNKTIGRNHPKGATKSTNKSSGKKKRDSQLSVKTINSVSQNQFVLPVRNYWFTVDECQTVVSKITPSISSKEYAKEDTYNFFVGLNLWCNIFQDVTHEDPILLKNRIQLYGIQNCIKEADQHRLWFLSQSEIGERSEFWSTYVELNHVLGKNWKLLSEENGSFLLTRVNTLLGCLRRILVKTLDPQEAIDGFLRTNKKCGYFGKTQWSNIENRKDNYTCEEDWNIDHPNPSSFILEHLREILLVIFHDYKKDSNLFTLPPGSTYEGYQTYYEKWKKACENRSWLFEHGVILPSTVTNTNNSIPADCNRYIVVPKDYKKGRGVCPEPVSRQILAYQIDSGMRKCLRKIGIDLNDQSINQQLCKNAFKLGLTTVDKSSASDLISLDLVRELFSYTLPDLYSDMIEARTNYTMIDGKKVRNQHFSTMGNAMTCAIQSSIFAACAILALSLVHPEKVFYNSSFPKKRRNYYRKITDVGIAVYNDDVIIPNDIYDVYTHICTSIGFEINKDKTYTGEQLYRESCGVEYLCTKKKTFCCTGTYYPRGTSRDALQELLGLQHNYVDYHYANNFLISLILDVFPRMTCSYVPENSEETPFDIWSRTSISVEHRDFVSPSAEMLHGYEVILEKDESSLSLKKAGTLYTIRLVYFSSNFEEELKEFFSELKAEGLKISSYKRVRNKLKKVDMCNVYQLLLDCGIEIPQDEKHCVLTSVPGCKAIPKGINDDVELLMYCLKTNNGISHINDSVYTNEEDYVLDPRDLICKRKTKIVTRWR